jgi:uncharacterized OsmC-like protein
MRDSGPGHSAFVAGSIQSWQAGRRAVGTGSEARRARRLDGHCRYFEPGDSEMKISARIRSSRGQNDIMLATNSQAHSIQIAPKATGLGSTANGGELLFLALATCYCNDIYREAAKRAIEVTQVEIEVTGEFGAEGEPARNVSYAAKVWAHAPDETIRELMSHTDGVAEIQNTLRRGAPVTLSRIEAVTVDPCRSDRARTRDVK